MSVIGRCLYGVVLGLGVGAGATPAVALTTFATFSPVADATNIRWTQSGTLGGQIFSTGAGGSAASGLAAVKFGFLQPVLSDLGMVDADFRLDGMAMNSPAFRTGGLTGQPMTLSSISFTYSGTQDLQINGRTYSTGANLLSVSLTGGVISGRGSSGGFFGSTEAGDTILFSSDIVTFDNSAAKDLALSLTSIAPALFAQSGQSVRSFSATSGGTFSTDILPTLAPPLTMVPEPGTWAMLILGFGLIGGQIRRRRSVETVAA